MLIVSAHSNPMEKPPAGTLLVAGLEGKESVVMHDALHFCPELILITSRQVAVLHGTSVGWRSAILPGASKEEGLEYLWTALINVTLTYKEHMHLLPAGNHPDSIQSLHQVKVKDFYMMALQQV